MPPRGWTLTGCKHGHQHWVLSQTTQYGCGLAACGMIVNRKKGIQDTDTDILLKWEHRETRWPSQDGDIETLLKVYDVRGKTHRGLTKSHMKDLVRAASIQAPIIAAVTWEGGST